MHLAWQLPRKKWLVAGIILFLILGLVSYKVWSGQSNKSVIIVKTAQVKKQDLEANIYTTGTLQPAQQKEYYAKAATTVKEILKEPGTKVTQGEPIIILDDSQALLDLGQAESTLALQESEYRKGLSNKLFLEKKLEDAQKNLQRQEQLYELGAVALKEMEGYRLEVASLENQLAAIDLKALEAQVNKAKLALQGAREVAASTVITSPFDGTVLKIGVKENQPVTPGMFIASIGDVHTLEVNCSVNEYDALKLKIGQKAQISSEGLREKKFSGEITQVAPQAEVEQTPTGSENRVKVKLTLTEKVEELKPGYSVNVKILTDKKADALIVPIEALLQRDGKDVVFVYQDGLAVLREVKKGLSTELYQEITEGLAQGELVIITSQEKLKDNTRVKTNDKNK
ncbi:MAG: family efflux transporter, subunit [Peptococcaceae bacterium]|nr:family efflux transporter, subunit [Peptococcaceae bacterium]